MSLGYGVDFYGTTTYGYAQQPTFSVAPFTAYQRDYQRIALSWKTPGNSTWKSLVLVRSQYGFPSSPADGTTLLTIFPTAAITNYEDLNILPGTLYYYAMFLSLEAPAWSNSTTYSAGTVVLYNNLYWLSITSSNTGNTPAVGSAFWENVQYQPVWYPAGYVSSLSVTNQGYSPLLYNRTPQPYKVSNSDLFANTVVDNPALQHYLSIFGFHLDMTKTEYDLYLQGNNPDVISSTSLDILGQQLGITTDYLSPPQSRRQRVKNIAINYRLKGTSTSIHNAVAAVTGWDSIITNSPNLMASGDQSAFAHPMYDLWDQSITYFPNQLVQFNGYNYKNLVQSYGTSEQPTGTNTSNTWWSVQVSTPGTPLLDTTNALRNPISFFGSGTGFGGYSTWATQWTVDAINSTTVQPGVYIGLPHPTNGSINNWNALGYEYTSTGVSPNPNFNYSINVPYIPAWNNSTNYVVNNFVTNSSNNWRALKPSGPGTPYGFITPGTNDQFWVQVFVPSVGVNTRDFTPDSVPVTRIQQWNSSLTYSVGTQVQYFGIIYQAINQNKNSTPSGYYYSNANWIYIQPSEYAYISSAYNTRATTSTTLVNTYIYPRYIDRLNNLETIYQTDVGSYLSRFDGDYFDLNGVNDNTQEFFNKPWTATPSTPRLWRSNYGMASVDQTLFGTTTYVYLTVADGRSDVNLALTFVTDYNDPAHIGHGIIFRYQDPNNFWYATRKSLYLVSGGVETLKASWTRLVNNDRMFISILSNAITVYKYTRDGSGNVTQLAQVFSTTLETATVHGIIQKYSPSGAV